ncbi:MAG: hypothetical protein AUJ97_02760 [Bacteroidetes bacterium CG2_30_32_10]|nr:MAG: hypothetical protein AUJ97_02760 [Bacteroidetes bacterium CG2_30_32_10]
MKKIIACCGLDCATCDARIATLTNDNDLRAKTAEKWKVQYNAPDISPETINCNGCTEEGIKFAHCNQYEIRNCVISKGFKNCADCDKLESCSIVRNIHKYVPDALENLKSLN